MDLGHKFLAFKTAMNNNYKIQNFITAAAFAKLILEMEPTGVRPTDLIFLLDICKQARDDSPNKEVLPGIPTEGN